MTTDDDFLARIGRFNDARGGGVLVERRQGGYTLHHEASGAPIARLRPTGRADTVNVLYWSHRGKWSQIGDFGGITLPLDEALAYVAENGISGPASEKSSSRLAQPGDHKRAMSS